MKRFSLLVYAILVQVLILLWLMPCAHAQQQPIICDRANATACTTTSPGTATGTWDPAWLIGGKTNANFLQLYGMFGPSSSLKNTGTASSADLIGVLALPSGVLKGPSLTAASGTDLASAAGCLTNAGAFLSGNGICAQGIVSAASYGADATGTNDSTSAINLALSTKINGTYQDVYLPPGTYKISNTLTIGQGACLYGADRLNTTLLISSNFNASATMVITNNTTGTQPTQVAEYNYRYGTCVHDLTILGQQPVGGSTTASSTVSSGSTITTATAPPVGYLISDGSKSTFPIQHLTHVVSVTGSGPFTVTLDKALTGTVTSGDTIILNVARGSLQALGSCSSTAFGSGCKYPWFIQPAAFNAVHLWNLVLSGCWDGVNAQRMMFLDTVDFGCVDKGLEQDFSDDFSSLRSLRFHPTYGWNGFQNNANADDIFWDGQTYAWVQGRSDGLDASDISTFGAGVHFTSAANSSAGNWRIHGMFLDGPGSIMFVEGGSSAIDGMTISSTDTVGTNGGYAYLQTAGVVRISHGLMSAQQQWLSLPVLEMQMNGTGAELHISDSTFGTGTQTRYLTVNSGTVADVHDSFVQVVGGALTTTPFVQSGTAGIMFYDNYSVPGGGGGGAIINIGTDNFYNRLTGNNFVNYVNVFPTGSTSGLYQDPGNPANYAITPSAVTVNSAAASGSPLTVNNSASAGAADGNYCNNLGHCVVIGSFGSANGFADKTAIFSVSSQPLVLGGGAFLCAQVNPDKTVQYICPQLFSSLPTCNAGEQGATTFITNGPASPTYLAAAAGGGTTVTPVFCNGTTWVNH